MKPVIIPQSFFEVIEDLNWSYGRWHLYKGSPGDRHLVMRGPIEYEIIPKPDDEYFGLIKYSEIKGTFEGTDIRALSPDQAERFLKAVKDGLDQIVSRVDPMEEKS